MSGRRKGGRRKLSAGTVFMLGLLAVVICGSVLVLGRLSSGASINLNRKNVNVLELQEDPSRDTTEETKAAEGRTETAQVTAPPVYDVTPVPQETNNSCTLTIGGSISLSGEVRKNSWNADSKVTDYADVMMLLAPQIKADVNVVFLENILSDKHKANDNTAPASASGLLKEAGFGMAACGFSQSYANGREGVEATLDTLNTQGIKALGIRYADEGSAPVMTNAGGVKTAFLQYTSTISSKTRKAMIKEETSGMVPDADIEQISADIAAAREQGAEAVIVLVNWGKNGKEPDRTQKELAAGIAQAGADMIVGNGSHIPQAAEYITGKDGSSVLCVWSLGTLLGGDRGNVKRQSGYLLHVTIRSDGKGGALILGPEYTPVYTWKYKQDGRYYYRCIASNGSAPDGMDKDQRKNMSHSAETVESILKNTPLTVRGLENAD
ncbi:MAG: CapA family protein [Clostridia bacterium]|nr:CapA family protein [Clostridia bacterium]